MKNVLENVTFLRHWFRGLISHNFIKMISPNPLVEIHMEVFLDVFFPTFFEVLECNRRRRWWLCWRIYFLFLRIVNLVRENIILIAVLNNFKVFFFHLMMAMKPESLVASSSDPNFDILTNIFTLFITVIFIPSPWKHFIWTWKNSHKFFIIQSDIFQLSLFSRHIFRIFFTNSYGDSIFIKKLRWFQNDVYYESSWEDYGR